MKGLIAHLPLPVADVARYLPQFSDNDLIYILPSAYAAHPKTIRLSKVQRALEWLYLYNPIYSDCDISYHLPNHSVTCSVNETEHSSVVIIPTNWNS